MAADSTNKAVLRGAQLVRAQILAAQQQQQQQQKKHQKYQQRHARQMSPRSRDEVSSSTLHDSAPGSHTKRRGRHSHQHHRHVANAEMMQYIHGKHHGYDTPTMSGGEHHFSHNISQGHVLQDQEVILNPLAIPEHAVSDGPYCPSPSPRTVRAGVGDSGGTASWVHPSQTPTRAPSIEVNPLYHVRYVADWNSPSMEVSAPPDFIASPSNFSAMTSPSESKEQQLVPETPSPPQVSHKEASPSTNPKKKKTISRVTSMLTRSRSLDKSKSRPSAAVGAISRTSSLGTSSSASPAASQDQHGSQAMDKPRTALEHRQMLSNDEAYQHAKSAGLLWQTLVGEFVRFPSTWWEGARVPLMSSPPEGEHGNCRPEEDGRSELSSSMQTTSALLSPFSHTTKWAYISRNRVRGNPYLNALVINSTSRSKGGGKGRLLLHVVVQDTFSWMPVRDVVVGCFHPKHVEQASVKSVKNALVVCDEDVRELFMAVRKHRVSGQEQENHSPAREGGGFIASGGCSTQSSTTWDGECADSSSGTQGHFSLSSSKCRGIKHFASSFASFGSASLIDPMLTENRALEDVAKPGPLGEKKKCNNSNVCAIFGDKPPKITAFVTESQLHEMMCSAKENSMAGTSSPAILLLQEFLFKKAGI